MCSHFWGPSFTVYNSESQQQLGGNNISSFQGVEYQYKIELLFVLKDLIVQILSFQTEALYRVYQKKGNRTLMCYRAFNI